MNETPGNVNKYTVYSYCKLDYVNFQAMLCHDFTAMLLGSLKTPYKEIRRRILEVDAEHLTTGMLEQLIKYLPEPEQIKELAALKEEYDDLAEAEQFIATVCKRKKMVYL